MTTKMKKVALCLVLQLLLASSAAATTIWTGSEVIDWYNGKALQLSKDLFVNLKEGDALVFGITFTGNTDWPQISLVKGDWSGTVSGAANTGLSDGMTEVKYYVLSDMMADLQATGLIVSGCGFILNSIEQVDGDGGDYSHAVWIGEMVIGNWNGFQISASAFSKAQVGQFLRIKFKDLGAGAILSPRDPDGWGQLPDAENVEIAGGYHQYVITAAMLEVLQARGLIVGGVNFTCIAVELWNADEMRPLTLSVPVTNNWVYEGSSVPSFTIHAENPHNDAVIANIEVRVTTDKLAPVTTLKKTVTLAAGSKEDIDVTMAEMPAPGIYKAAITVNEDLARAFFFAVNPTQIVSAPDKQDDFDNYWTQAKEQLAQVPINAKLTEIPSKSGTKRKVYLVEMQSVADGLTGEPVIVRGYYAEPQDGKKHPVIMHYQGYDSEYRPGGDSAIPWCIDTRWDSDESAQFAEFILSNRGQSINNRPASGRDDGINEDFTNIYGDWFAYEFGNKDSYYYRGAYMDCVRAIDFIASRETTDVQNIFAEGQSQGGAFTVAAAALTNHPLDAIAPAITFMGDFPDYFQLVSWPAQVAFANQGTMSDDEMYAFLSYFDTKNLATGITCPYITSIGLQDNVCPPHTNIAPYNNCVTPADDKQIVFNPELQHATNAQWYQMYMSFFKKYMKDTTGINDISLPNNIEAGAIYNLNGMRITQPTKGIYIVNGKKVIL